MFRFSPLIPYVAVAVGMYALQNAWAAMLLYHAGVLLVLIVDRKSDPLPKRSPSIKVAWIPAIAAVFAMGGVLLFVLWPFLGRDGDLVGGRLAVLGLTRRMWLFFLVYFCVVNATMEEMFWRGRLGSDSKLLTVNDMYFAGYHVLVLLAFMSPLWGVLVFAVCTFGGWLWRQLRAQSGGLLLPVLTHIAADASIIAAVHYRVFR